MRKRNIHYNGRHNNAYAQPSQIVSQFHIYTPIYDLSPKEIDHKLDLAHTDAKLFRDGNV